MDKLFGFVAPALRGVINPLLTVTGSILGTVKNGVEEIAKVSEEKPKTSGGIGGLLVYLGVDPSALHTIGMVLGKVSGWLQAI